MAIFIASPTRHKNDGLPHTRLDSKRDGQVLLITVPTLPASFEIRERVVATLDCRSESAATDPIPRRTRTTKCCVPWTPLFDCQSMPVATLTIIEGRIKPRIRSLNRRHFPPSPGSESPQRESARRGTAGRVFEPASPIEVIDCHHCRQVCVAERKHQSLDQRADNWH
jgi:hypothetical protein